VSTQLILKCRRLDLGWLEGIKGGSISMACGWLVGSMSSTDGSIGQQTWMAGSAQIMMSRRLYLEVPAALSWMARRPEGWLDQHDLWMACSPPQMARSAQHQLEVFSSKMMADNHVQCLMAHWLILGCSRRFICCAGGSNLNGSIALRMADRHNRLDWHGSSNGWLIGQSASFHNLSKSARFLGLVVLPITVSREAR